MINRDELQTYLKQFLRTDQYQDYCPNGLQVEGRSQIQNLVTGVTACQALLERAVELNADAILVHHGYFWKNEEASVVCIKAKRLKTLLTQDINLFAYHLPLDGHQKLGNNAELGRLLDVQEIQFLDGPYGCGVGCKGKLLRELSAELFAEKIAEVLNRKPQLIKVNDKPIKTIAWCTGGAQDFIQYAAKLNVDAFLSGEISEQTFHLAQEYGLHYFACGHHATERYGVKALGEHLAQRFDLNVQFVDIDNPI